MDLLLATRNPHKTRELAGILGNDFSVSDLSAMDDVPPVEETGRTFAENAILKALSVTDDRNAFVVADDSGLEVDALEGAPGIYSARYAGANATDRANLVKLLDELERRNVPMTERTARFRCAIALARSGKLLGTFEGVVDGLIVDLARGDSGFGYDPIFVPDGFDKTFAELPAETKNSISHRGRAVQSLVRYLKTVDR